MLPAQPDHVQVPWPQSTALGSIVTVKIHSAA
jgi:hypothetical protein